MKTLRSISFVGLVFLLSGYSSAQEPTASKCHLTDSDCFEREKQTAMSEAKKVKVDETDPKVSFPPGLSASARTDTFYRPKPAATPTPAGQAPTDPTQTQTEDAQALAKKLSNPVAALISLPLQSTFDFGMGSTGDGFRYTLTVQPVIPIKLNEKWNLISRTVTPIMAQKDVVGTTSQFGLGDIIQTLLISPNSSEPLIWGVGPQVLIPTATNEFLGSKKLGIGPAVLVAKQTGGWTYGMLMGHIWSVAGSSSRPSVSTTNLQPILSYSTKTGWTYALNSESTYDWNGHQWNVPIHFNITKLVRLGKQRVSVGGGIRCWAISSPTGPSGCGFRVLFTPLFPKK